MKRLFVYLPSQTAAEVSWSLFDSMGNMEHTVALGNISDLKNYASGCEITAIIPGLDVLLTQVKLPILNRHRLLQALPYALEDQLIDDVQELHFALGERQADETLPVIIMARKKLEAYLEKLKQAGLTIKKMIPSTLALPITKNHWSLALQDNICLIRTSEHHGFACDAVNIKTFLALQFASTPQKPEYLNIYRYADAPSTIQATDIIIHDMPLIHNNIIETMGTWLCTNKAINVLQGDYLPRQSPALTKKIWLISGCITAAWVILLFISKIVSYIILQHSLHQSELAINTIYKKHFPAATSIVAPRERMQEKLKHVSSDIGKNYILGLLGILGNSLRQHPDIRITQLDFRENNLNLSVIASSFAALDAFSRSLKQQGLMVKQQSASMSEAGTKANLIIKTGAA